MNSVRRVALLVLTVASSSSSWCCRLIPVPLVVVVASVIGLGPSVPAAAGARGGPSTLILVGSLSSQLSVSTHTVSQGLTTDSTSSSQLTAVLTEDVTTKPHSLHGSVTILSLQTSRTTSPGGYTCTTTMPAPVTFEAQALAGASLDAQGGVQEAMTFEAGFVDKTVTGNRVCVGPGAPADGPEAIQVTVATQYCGKRDGPGGPVPQPATGVNLNPLGPYPRYEVHGQNVNDCVAPFATPDETRSTTLHSVTTAELHREPTVDDRPNTVLTLTPNKQTASAKATFKFKARSRGARFTCSLDGAAYKDCSSPLTVRVKPGKHTLRVLAHQYGLDETRAEKWTWRYVPRRS